MPRQPRRTSPRLELFEKDAPPVPPGTPLWTALPDKTRHAPTGLATRMLIAHAGVPAMMSEDEDDGL